MHGVMSAEQRKATQAMPILHILEVQNPGPCVWTCTDDVRCYLPRPADDAVSGSTHGSVASEDSICCARTKNRFRCIRKRQLLWRRVSACQQFGGMGGQSMRRYWHCSPRPVTIWPLQFQHGRSLPTLRQPCRSVVQLVSHIDPMPHAGWGEVCTCILLLQSLGGGVS